MNVIFLPKFLLKENILMLVLEPNDKYQDITKPIQMEKLLNYIILSNILPSFDRS